MYWEATPAPDTDLGPTLHWEGEQGAGSHRHYVHEQLQRTGMPAGMGVLLIALHARGNEKATEKDEAKAGSIYHKPTKQDAHGRAHARNGHAGASCYCQHAGCVCTIPVQYT